MLVSKMKKIEAEIVKTGLKTRIALYFPFNRDVVGLIRPLAGAHWSPERKCWLISGCNGPIENLNLKFRGKLQFIPRAEVVEKKKEGPGKEEKMNQWSEPRGKPLLQIPGQAEGNSPDAIKEPVWIENGFPEEYLKALILKRYSERTVTTYTSLFRQFMEFYKRKPLDGISDEEIRDYLLHLNISRKVSDSYLNQTINAIKFYYEKVLGRPCREYYLQRPRASRKLPEVMSMDEVASVLQSVSNIKHKCILFLIYSGGLRLGEVTNLKANDIDSSRMMIKIRQGKGKKDRYTLLSDRALELLRQYFRSYRPKEWLFTGNDGGQYSDRSVQEIFYKAVRHSGLRKHVSVHTLRHSFATNLLEQGTDIRYIQELLGHSNIKTTLVYSHVTRRGLDGIKSPLDSLKI